MGVLSRLGYVLVLPYMGVVLSLLFAVVVGALVYVVLVLQQGIMTAAEVAKLPLLGTKLQRFVRTKKVVK